MKSILIGLWVAIVALGSAYGVAISVPQPGAKKVEAPVKLEPQKSRVISVPMIADGAPQGFVTMQFNYTVDGEMLKSVKVPPDIYLIDEAFRTVYSDPALDFRHLEKYDVNGLLARLLKATNDRLGVPLVKELLIDNFAFIPKDQRD